MCAHVCLLVEARIKFTGKHLGRPTQVMKLMKKSQRRE